MTSDEAASDDAASDDTAYDDTASDNAASDDVASNDAASDDAASDDMTSGPLVFRSTILQEHYSYFRSDLTSGALFLFSSKLPSEASKLQIVDSFCSLIAHSEPINDVTF